MSKTDNILLIKLSRDTKFDFNNNVFVGSRLPHTYTPLTVLQFHSQYFSNGHENFYTQIWCTLI